MLRSASRLAARHVRVPALSRSVQMTITKPPPGLSDVIFIETGCGTDQHGQDVTKACVRACKDAISWNSIPSLERLVPGGNDGVKIRLQLAVPFEAGGAKPPPIDMSQIEACFAYGTLQQPVEILPGGARFESMCSVPSLGDSESDSSWVVAIACVTVGY
jgi:uncharacterized protein (TIGR02058 family)